MRLKHLGVAQCCKLTSPVSSVPCVPTDVAVEIDCSKNQAVVSWSASEGALSYKVSAQSMQGAMSLCEGADLMCILTNLTCGQSYSVQVVAQDDLCSSLPSQAARFHSGNTTGLAHTSSCLKHYCSPLFFLPPSSS